MIRFLIISVLITPFITAQIINGSFITQINASVYAVTVNVSMQSETGTAGVLQIDFSFNSSSLSYPFTPQKDIDYVLYEDFDTYVTQNITRPSDNKLRISLLTLDSPSPVTLDTTHTSIITFYFSINGNGGTSALEWIQTDIAPAFLQPIYEIGNWPNLDEQLPIWTSISMDKKMPGEYKLFQNYPNPFNPTTKIEFTIPEASSVIIKIFDLTGREIEELVNEEFKAGINKVIFDGSRYNSGIYFYRIMARNQIITKKMILLK